MHTYLWIVASWIIVAIVCYLWLIVYGNGDGRNSRRGTVTSTTRRTGEWFNEVIFWLWRSRRFSPAFAETFTKALNDSFMRIGKTKNYTFDARFELPLSLFTRATSGSVRTPSRVDIRRTAKPPDDSAMAPYLEHITASMDSSEHLTFSARLCVPKLTLKLHIVDHADGKTMAHELTFNDVCGEVEARVAQIADELFVMGCFSGRPKLNVTATSIDAKASAAHSARDLEELARRCFISAVLNFSVGEILYPDSMKNCVRLSGEIRNFSMLNDIYKLGEAHRKHTGESHQADSDQQVSCSPTINNNAAGHTTPNSIHVLVLGARNLSPNYAVRHPFVAVEVNEPAQKFVTAPLADVYNPHNPQWNENFEIIINESTKELLFEVYDGDSDHSAIDSQQHQRSARKFLGFVIVSVAELTEANTSKVAATKPFVFQLPLHARPYSTHADDVTLEPNVDGGILLVQCQFVRSNAKRQIGLTAPFPTQANEVLRGSLSNFDRGYLYNNAQEDTQPTDANLPRSPSSNANWNFDKNKPSDIFSNQSLSRSQSSHLNSSILVGRPESALSKNASGSQANAHIIPPPFGRSESRGDSSSHHSSQLSPLQIQSSQRDSHSRSQPSPYDRLELRSQSSGIVESVNKAATHSPSNLISPTIVEPLTPRDGHVQFINGKSGKASSKRSSPFRTTSETVVGAEAWTPPLHATSMAALSPVRPGIFDFPSTQNINENLDERTTSPQPPPIPPHHQSRFDANFEMRAQEQNRTRESSSPQKSRRDGSKSRRERSFFDNLRERLTRGTTSKRVSKRARSLDTDNNTDLEEAAVSAPTSRDQSQVRSGSFRHPEVISTSSSTHSASGVPKIGRDANIQSTLILEVVDEDKSDATKSRNKYHRLGNIGHDDEGNVLLNSDYSDEPRLRYYLIPHDVATQPAAENLLRAGKKLHVINNHTFVAAKPRGRMPCSVCAKVITSNFTKQAYQCRDCRKVTHKSCHLRGTSPCQESTLYHLPIIDNVNWEDFLRRYQMQEFISLNGV